MYGFVTKTTIRIPDELHKEAKKQRINVSLACLHGIRIHLGLKCPILENCKCFKKTAILQDLLLQMEQRFIEAEDKFRRQRDYAWTIQEKRRK